MAATKVRTEILDASSLVPATPQTVDIDMRTSYGGSINIKIVNGATGPTLAAQAQIQTSADDTTYYNFGGPLVAGVTNAATYTWGGIDIPIGVMYLRVVFGENTDQNVTVTADIAEVTAVA